MKNSAGSVATPKRLRRTPDGRRIGPIEDVIGWAWREELPKAPAVPLGPDGIRPGLAKMQSYAAYGSLVDLHDVNRFGCVPDMSADSWPCADAVAIGEAVLALDAAEIEIPADWNPAPELDAFGGLGAKAVRDAWRRLTRIGDDGRTVLRIRPSELIARHVVTGTQPEALTLADVTMEAERWQNGKDRWFVREIQHRPTGIVANGIEQTEPFTIEVNGVDKRGQPKPGAYRRHYLDPDPVAIVIARAEHEILVDAVEMVREMVADRLTEIVALPTAMLHDPWNHPARAARILPDLAGEAAAAAAEAERRATDFARRYPRWFRNLQRSAAKMRDTAA